MNQIENLIQFPERGGNITPHKMIAIPLLDFSVWAGNTMDIPDLGENPYSKSVLVSSEGLKHPLETFAYNVKGDSMEPLLFEGDVIIVDCSFEVTHNLNPDLKYLVVAWNGDSSAVKWLKKVNDQSSLVPQNPKYTVQPLTFDSNYRTVGVVVGMSQFITTKEFIKTRLENNTVEN